MASIGKFSESSFFVGQSAMILFDQVADYETAVISSFTGKKLGDVKLDSTSWTGDDIEISNLQNESGDIVASTAVAGTYSFEAVVMSTDEERLTELMKAVEVVDAGATVGSWIDASSGSIVGWGDELSIIERPIAIVNDTNQQTLIFPKAKITSTPAIEDKLMGIKISAVAQKISTDDLKTVMLINGVVSYA